MTDNELAAPPELPRLGGPAGQSLPAAAATPEDLRRLNDLPVRVTAVVGRTKMAIGALLAIKPGQVLELDRKVGESIEILVNDRLVARGEVVMVGDRLGVTMTEILKAEA